MGRTGADRAGEISGEMVRCFRHEGNGCVRCGGSGFRPRKRCDECGGVRRALMGLRGLGFDGPMFCRNCHPERGPHVLRPERLIDALERGLDPEVLAAAGAGGEGRVAPARAGVGPFEALTALKERADAYPDLDGEGLQRWMDFECEALRLGLDPDLEAGDLLGQRTAAGAG